MFIQYSVDGNYETFSNSKRKSLDVFFERKTFVSNKK